MSIIRSFVKTKERLEKEQAVIQAVKKASTENNEQELLASSLLVPPQQSSGFGTLYYEAVVESMANVENTRSWGSYTKFTDVDRFQLGRYAGENGNKKALIYLKNKFLGLKESTVRTFKKQHQKELKKQDPRNDHLVKSSKQRKEGGRYILVGFIK